ncbi:MAG: hypothetical protein HOM14_05455 [Gammaproteobacteria bacterium]|nr:hypothetical protein [Gammaproteobacteria bacterium]MBT3723901.1 hypothetical protein [Gammaproteobacteria bacterium]MBT4078150.1 hypothetical protein [Gammaproteobacteria bacterium]MBT4194256.1 hypothetical protein [Gammaproteobacteria bacterium]MBT4451626.1 hypothetical protein [Gammaproteobacteria bacterium]
MKYLLILISCLISIHSVGAAFYDPMRPPAYALKKFRLQKLKNSPSAVKRQIKPKKAVEQLAFELNSILYSSNRQHAIINNQLVKKGDIINGAKLVGLKPDGVRLLSKGKFIDLKIFDSQPIFKSIKKSLNEKKI